MSLDKMLRYCGREVNILPTNQMILLSCLEMTVVHSFSLSNIVSVIVVANAMVVGNMHKLNHGKWGYIYIYICMCIYRTSLDYPAEIFPAEIHERTL